MELAVVVGRHFEGSLNIDEKDEQDCIQAFLQRLENGDRPIIHRNSNGTGSPGSGSDHHHEQRGRHNEYARTTAVGTRRHRGTAAARAGEQVAAKVTRTDENGSWILASVQRFYPETETYDVQDEDDTSKLIRLPWNHVIRLSLGTEGTFEKGTRCMAIFPETTSFYRAKVSKNPVWELESTPPSASSSSSSSRTNNNGHEFNVTPVVREVIVKFEDDEDGSGKTPHRRVPARYVIPIPADYFYDELEDVDMSLVDPGNKAS
jgi:SGF29 tudor-like domain